MNDRTYFMELKPNEGDAITREYLNESVRSVLTDDDFVFGTHFTLRLLFTQGITLEELTRDAKHLQCHGSNSGYCWYGVRVAMGDKYPELFLELRQE